MRCEHLKRYRKHAFNMRSTISISGLSWPSRFGTSDPTIITETSRYSGYASGYSCFRSDVFIPGSPQSRAAKLFSSRSNGHDGNPSNKLLGCWSAHCLRCSGFSRLARIEKDNMSFFDLMEDYFNQPLENLRKDERSTTSRLLSRLHGMRSISDTRMASQKTPPRMRTHSSHLNYWSFWHMSEERPYETRPEFLALRLTLFPHPRAGIMDQGDNLWKMRTSWTPNHISLKVLDSTF